MRGLGQPGITRLLSTSFDILTSSMYDLHSIMSKPNSFKRGRAETKKFFQFSFPITSGKPSLSKDFKEEQVLFEPLVDIFDFRNPF